MILHILKKDLKLVWPAMAAIMVLKLAAAGVVLQMGMFDEHWNLLPIQELVELACAALTCLTIVWTVQTDPIVSDNADWLIRPVKRRDLILAKAAFALAVTFVPVFVVNVWVGTVHGEALGTCLTRAIFPAVSAFLALGLPALAIGAITANKTQAVAVAGALLVVWAVAVLIHLLTAHNAMLLEGGLWAVHLVQITTVVATSIAVVGLQCSRHRTALSRGLFAGVAAILTATIFVPRDAALSFQHLIQSEDANAPLTVSFNAQAGTKVDTRGTPTLYVPLAVTKPNGSLVHIDGLRLRVTTLNGSALYNSNVGIIGSLPQLLFDPSPMTSKNTDVGAAVANNDYNKIKGQTVRASLAFHFTAYQASPPIQAVVTPLQRRTIAHVGVCESRQNDQNPAYTDLYCFPAADQATCMDGSVRYPDTGTVTHVKMRCLNELHIFETAPREMVAPARLVASYPTPAGNQSVQVTLTPYRMRSHFAQTVALPPMRLEN